MSSPSLDVAQVRAFLDVVEAGGITAAARRHSIAKSVVSDRVTGLERVLGVSLFVRGGGRLTLTERGKAFYEGARTLLGDLQRLIEVVQDTGGELTGRLRIAAPVTFGTMFLGDVVANFIEEHPSLTVELEVSDSYVDIVGQGFDLAVRLGALEDSALIGRKICAVRRYLCASPDYLDQHGVPDSIESLSQHKLIGYSNAQTSQWAFQSEDGMPPAIVSLRSMLVCNNGEIMRDVAIRGRGLILLPSFIVADAVARQALEVVDIGREPVPLSCYALYPRKQEPPRAVRAFIASLVQAIGNPPVWERHMAAAPVAVRNRAPGLRGVQSGAASVIT